jgi:hypothetical protein
MAPPKLHSLDALRVVAEYLVVRAHVGGFDEALNYAQGVSSFLFVLSGFALMYAFEKADFATWGAIRAFWWAQGCRFYPTFLINWLCWLPHVVAQWRGCWVYGLCPLLQLAMLDSWAGCGYLFLANGPSWYLSSLAWLWLLFPLIKDRLVVWFSSGQLWAKVAWINLGYACVFILLWDHDIYTLCAVPALRLGEFVMGCGAALALRADDPPALLADGAYWIWAAMAIGGTLCLERVDHGISFVCLHEAPQHSDCTLWHAGQQWIKSHTPCITTLEKILNKYALLWAGLIYGVARAESGGAGAPFLQADVFKFLSSFSLALYLGHLNMCIAIRWLAAALLMPGRWRDDALLLLVYALCYALHRLMLEGFKISASRTLANAAVYTSVNQERTTDPASEAEQNP